MSVATKNSRSATIAVESGQLCADGLGYRYRASGEPVLHDLTFTVEPATVTCIVGPSGCGKSTFLGLAAGLMAPNSGTLDWKGAPVPLGPSSHLGMAFQQPGLFPWMTVERNVTVGLRVRGRSKSEARAVAHEFLDLVGLGDVKQSYPRELSGGMAQRVGIARALALQPALLLLDEPFASVDAFTRITLQSELRRMLDVVQPTAVLVTHDVSEAITLGDQVIVMSSRPATVTARIQVQDADRDKSSQSYATTLSTILAELGVVED